MIIMMKLFRIDFVMTRRILKQEKIENNREKYFFFSEYGIKLLGLYIPRVTSSFSIISRKPSAKYLQMCKAG